MNYYEATHSKLFPGRNFRNTKNILVTAKDKVASLVNDSWIYSSHWPDDEGWVEKAGNDVDSAMELAKNRVRDLEQAKNILTGIKL